MNGHRDSEDRSQALIGQRADHHISENSYDPKNTKPHSHYTKLVPNDGEQYSQDKSVSYPTGYTKFQHNANVPLKILKQPTDHSTTYDFPVKSPNTATADRAHTTQSPGKRKKMT